ncbi:MoaD/ThiS family protein [Desulfocicer niacini]
MININLNFFATLRSFLPDSPQNMEIPEGTCVKDLVAEFGIPETDVKLIFINGTRQLPSYELKHNDRVGIFPPVGGG